MKAPGKRIDGRVRDYELFFGMSEVNTFLLFKPAHWMTKLQMKLCHAHCMGIIPKVVLRMLRNEKFHQLFLVPCPKVMFEYAY